MNWTKIRNEIEAEIQCEREQDSVNDHKNNMKELNIEMIN